MIVEIKELVREGGLVIGFDLLRGGELYLGIVIDFSCLFYVV